MRKIDILIEKLFPNCEIDLRNRTNPNNQSIYTYFDKINGIDFKMSIKENTSSASCLFILCDKNLIDKHIILEYVTSPLEQQTINEIIRKFEEALKEDGIDMFRTYIIDIEIKTPLNLNPEFEISKLEMDFF